MDQFYQTPQSYNPKRRKFIALAIGMLILALLAMMAFVFKDQLTGLFGGAANERLDWGGARLELNQRLPCLAPVRTQPGSTFNLDTEQRFKLYNHTNETATNVTVQVESDRPDLIATAGVTVSSGTYNGSVWTIPSIAPGTWQYLRIRKSGVNASPFYIRLTGGEGSLSTSCTADSFVEFLEPDAPPAPTPGPGDVNTETPTITPATTTPPATEPASEPVPVPVKEPTPAVEEVKGETVYIETEKTITPTQSKDASGIVVIDPGTVPPPPQQCVTTMAGFNTLNASFRVLKNEAVVVIRGEGCATFNFSMFTLGSGQEVLPFEDQDEVETKQVTLGYGTHYIELAPAPCSFQSDLFFVGKNAAGQTTSTLLKDAYDWYEHGCDTPPPTPQPLVCAPATQTVAVNATANFSVTGGTAPYTWSTTGDNPTKPPVGSTTTFTYGTAGNYTVTVEDSSTPTKKTATCAVLVNATPPPPPGQTLTCAPTSQNAVIGSPVRFTSTYSGQGLTYRWTATDGDPSSGLSDSFTTTYRSSDPDNTIPTGQTIKKIVTVSVGGETATCEVILSNAPVNVQTLVCAPATQIITAGGTATFTATGGSGNYVWSTTGDNPTKPPTGLSAQFTYGTPGTYTVTVSDSTVTTNIPGTCTVTVNAVTTEANADLAITKSVSNPTPQLNGEAFFYTVIITNLGPNNATGVSVRDILPTSVTYISSNPSQGTYNANDGVWSVGALNVGRDASLQITARANATGTHRNTATITASSLPDPVTSNNEAFVDITVTTGGTTTSYDIGVTKSVSNSSPSLNQNTEYTITATNNSSNTATNVTLRDVLPSQVTHVSDTASVGSYNENTGIWTIGTMTSGASATLHIMFTPNSTGTIVNTVTLNGLDQNDSNSSNNTASATITVSSGGGGGGGSPRADIAVVKTVNNAFPALNSNVIFTIRAFNNGPRNATDVELRDILPSGLVYVSHTVSAGSYSQSTGIWTIGDLDDGDSENLTITATATQIGTTTNTATVTGSSPSDTNSSNDEDSASVTVGSGGGGPGTDLAVTKTVSNALPAVGSQITYTINLANVGSTTANNITIIDTLPSGLTFVKAQATVGSYNKTNGIWTVGTLPRGGSAVLQLTVTVNRVGTIVNAARLNGSDPTDSNPLNNEGQVTITSHAAPGLPAAGLNNAAPIVIGFLFILLSIVVRFLGSLKPQTVYVDDRRKINSFIRHD